MPKSFIEQGMPSHSWRWDSNERGNPQQLANAKATLLACGLETIPNLMAAAGKDYEKEQISAARSYGLEDDDATTDNAKTAVEKYQAMVAGNTFSRGGSTGRGAGGDGALVNSILLDEPETRGEPTPRHAPRRRREEQDAA